MAGRGGKRPGAGRPKGRRNNATIDREKTITEMAREFTELALSALAEVARAGSDGARVSAANSILDRGYGKPPATMDVTNSDGTLRPTAFGLVPLLPLDAMEDDEAEDDDFPADDHGPH